MRLGPPPEVPEIPGQFWIDFIRDTAPVFRKPTIEQLGEFIAPTFQALIDGSKYVDPRLDEIFDELGPDVIVEDNVVAFPALAGVGPTVGPDRVVQPGRGEGPGRAALLVRLPGRGPGRLAGLPRGGAPDPRRHVGRLRRLLPRARRDHPHVRRARAGLHGRVPVPQPVLVPGRGRLPARAAARPHLAPAGLDGPGGRHDLGAPRAPARARRGAHLPLARVAGLGGRRADAAAGRPARRRRSTGSSCRRARWPTRSRSTTTRPARASCPSRRSCRRSTSSSRTAATTRSPRPSTTASR